MTRSTWWIIALRVLRGAVIAACVFGFCVVAIAVVAWDSDLYELRDRYERAKLALLGNWTSEHRCPPGRVSEDCAELDAFEAALSAASDFTFFLRAEIEATGHIVHTGIRFTTARDVVSGAPEAKWCYVVLSDGTISTQIDLATQSAEEPPVYATLSSMDESALAGSGLSPEMLRNVARSHCRFDN